MEFVRRLQALDRRIIYLLLVGVLSLPFVVSFGLPIYADTYTQQYFNEIEELAADPATRGQVILVLSNWGPGTSGENEPQFRVLLRHLLRRRLPFVLLCSRPDPVFHDAATAALERAQEDERQWAARHGQARPTWTYGEDYLDFGYKNAPVFAPLARTIITAAREFYGQDFVQKKSLALDESFPLLGRFRSMADVSAVLVISETDESRDIAGLVQSQYPHLRIGPATVGIAATDLYPYVKSGQFFGLLNSARAATEYRMLLNPDEALTRPTENALSLGKCLLLVLVLVGNLAYLISRGGAAPAQVSETKPAEARAPLPPLPRGFMRGLFVVFLVVFAGSVIWECVRVAGTGTLPRTRGAPGAAGELLERVGAAELRAEVQEECARARNPLLARFAEREAEVRRARLVEARVRDFIVAFLTIGVFAFLLGDNRFYRFIEAIMVGGTAAYLLDQIDQILRPDWWEPIVGGLTGAGPATNALWLLLALPGGMWYCAYARRLRWLNQLIVAVFIGLAIGPEFRKQINLLIPQVLDTIQPVWPWTLDTQTGGRVLLPSRIEHLVFTVVAVLALAYFIFSWRPASRWGRGTLAASRIVLMIGFGAMFGNTVNTRLAWLTPRIGFLLEEWLGKLWGGV